MQCSPQAPDVDAIGSFPDVGGCQIVFSRASIQESVPVPWLVWLSAFSAGL